MSKGARDYPYLVCRDLGHAWEETTRPTYFTSSYRGRRIYHVDRQLECVRCQTIREESYTGIRVTRRSYRYPEGYKLPQGMDREDVKEAALKQGAVRRLKREAS